MRRPAVPHAGAVGQPPRPRISAASPARSSSGTVAPGRPGRGRCPRAARARVARIVTCDGDLDEAVAGQSVTLTLADEIDVSRGDVHRGRRARRRRRRPVRGHAGLDGRGADAARAALPVKIGTQTVSGHASRRSSTRSNVNTLEHLAAKTLELNEIGVCNLDLDRADRVRALRREPRPRRLHPDRPDDQQHGRRRAAALRAAPRRQRPLAGARRRQARARAALKGQQPCVRVVHRAVGRRQVDDRQPGREAAARAGPAHLPARRRQRPPRPQQGPRLHRSRPRREHPPRRRGRQADGRRRPDRAGRLHLAVPRRAAAWRASCSATGEFVEVFVDTPLRWPSSATSRASTRRRGAAS